MIRVDSGAIVLTTEELRMLYQVAGLGRLRDKYRIGNTRAYELLTAISVAVFSDADHGTPPRHPTASEEREYWTVRHVAQATRRAERTVRKDCETGALPAMKNPSWLIHNDDAATYIAAHRTH